MLEADSGLYGLHSFFSVDGCRDVFAEAVAGSTDEVISHLESALVDRRTRLYTLATSKLCCKELAELKVTDDRLLDEKATDVFAALERRNVPVPSALHPGLVKKTVFHNEYLTPGLGESLYRRGFIDVDGISTHGLTPLMCMGDPSHSRLKPALQRVSWLMSKGADPGRTPDQSRCTFYHPNFTAAHHICSWIGQAWYPGDLPEPWWHFRILDGLEDDCQSIIGKQFCSRIYAKCLCACSSHGCTPATMMLKGIMSDFYYSDRASGQCVDMVKDIEICIWAIEWLNNFLGHSNEAWQWLSRDIIRYLTFEILGLTHTCCESYGCFPHSTRFNETEQEEIHEEERLTIGKLDALAPEFEEKYTELGVSVPDFLNGYWKTRMEEVEGEDEPLDEEEIAKIKDLGVVIHS